MARKASVRYWSSRGAYCCEFKGKQHTLAVGPDDGPSGPTFAAACKAHAELVCGRPSGPTFGAVCAAYLDWHAKAYPPATARSVRCRLQPIAAAFASRPVSELTGPTLEKWCAEQRAWRRWSDTTVRLTLRAARAAIRHALRERQIAANPVEGMKLPPDGVRGEEVVLSAAQEERVMSAARGTLHEFCLFLRDTGARPGEAMRAEARHFKPDLRAIVFPAVSTTGPTHKTAKKTGKPRIIYLRSESLALVERLCREHPAGALFRSPAKRRNGSGAGQRAAWTRNALTLAFGRLRRRANVPRLIPYSFRHTFAVRWLRSGRSADALAVVLGTSRLMIERNYGHLASQTDYLRGLVDGFDREVIR